MHIFKNSCLLILIAIIFQGCTPNVQLHGIIPSKDMLNALEIGIHTKDHVADFFGPPTTVSPFNDQMWVYNGKKTQTTSFFEPLILEQSTILFQFDENEILQGIYKVDMTKAITVSPSKNKTPTGGHDISFLQELFGSFGLFHRPTGLQD